MPGSPSTPVAVARRLRRVVRMMSLGSAVVAGLALTFVMLAVVTDVLSRNLRGRSVPGLIEYVEIILVVVVFLALAYTQTRREHVAVEALVNRLRGWQFRTVVALAGVTALFVVIVLTWATTQLAVSAFAIREYRLGLAQVPMWPARIAVAYGFALLALEFVTTIFEEWARGPDEQRVLDAGPL